MNHYNAENQPENQDLQGFPCDLFRLESKDSRPSELVDFESFDNWMDQELQELESRFVHNMTVNSKRSDLKSGR